MPTETPPHDDTTTTTTPPPAPPARPACPVCWRTFHPVGRQRYCSGNCRKTAWARSHTIPRPTIPVPAATRRRDTTIYLCPTCDTRYHAQQWCHDCNQPCTRIGPGGPCPHCDEPVTVSELFNQPQAPMR
jgi:hypothetical protein